MTGKMPFGMAIRGTLLLGLLGLGLCFEHFWPLRKTTQPKARRVAINLALAAIGALVLKAVFFPIVMRISERIATAHWGLLPRLGLGPAAELIVALLALDYTLYIWHWMNHEVPFLWRFHNAHHADLDMDVSTASRFHFGELILSTGFRSAQIVLFGIDPFTLILFETLVTTAAQFHHSNIRLPIRFEKYLNHVFVTPRMHGIHHSIVKEETDSNFSTIFSFWDHLHRSIRLNIPQQEVEIGVAAYRDPEELDLIQIFLLPFRRQRFWKLPNGIVPKRQSENAARPNQLIA